MLWRTWQRTAARFPDQPVVIEADSGRVWTCAELTQAAERLALAEFGVAASASERISRSSARSRSRLQHAAKRGMVTAFCLPNGGEWVVRFLACQRAGVRAAPLDPSLDGEALAGAARQLTAASPAFRVQRSQKMPSDAVCCLKITSGTSGQMTTVPCRARHLLADGRQIIASMGLRPRDRNLAIIPLGHSYGLGNLVLPLVLEAIPIVCTQGLVPRHLLEVIDRHRVTVLPTVPAVLRALALTAGAKRPAALRLVISAGAPLSAEVARQFHRTFGLKIHNFYGASETGGICYDRSGGATLTGRSLGRPLLGVTVRVRRDGRVVVRSAAVAVGRGQQVLPDQGEWNRFGELRLLGRVGRVANIGGRKVVPAELENCLRTVAGIADAWVTVLQDRHHRDYLAAAVETTRSREELEGELARHVAAWKLPKRWWLQPRLPRTERGKLDTAALVRSLSGEPKVTGG